MTLIRVPRGTDLDDVPSAKKVAPSGIVHAHAVALSIRPAVTDANATVARRRPRQIVDTFKISPLVGTHSAILPTFPAVRRGPNRHGQCSRSLLRMGILVRFFGRGQ